ncbi:MAG: hypothetical protein Ct9H300mP27_02670 [Chloroflexota bacterium]|nr:MAG: hypothetical protein Ct9H300mP27_02670 [Chloroflexota bacterium]
MKLWGFVPLGAVTGLGDGFLGGVLGHLRPLFFLHMAYLPALT